jgi:hypothetical protein
MTAPGNSAVLFILLAAFLACTGYAAGRLHQWYRTGQDRDEAYRDGYDTATRSVFSMAARIIGPRRAERPAVRASAPVRASEPTGVAGESAAASDDASCSPAVSSRRTSEEMRVLRAPSTRPGRHTVPEELVHAPTYRLAPDRVARAKVRESPLPEVPKPRSS